jgi:hypothetical protein
LDIAVEKTSSREISERKLAMENIIQYSSDMEEGDSTGDSDLKEFFQDIAQDEFAITLKAEVEEEEESTAELAPVSGTELGDSHLRVLRSIPDRDTVSELSPLADSLSASPASDGILWPYSSPSPCEIAASDIALGSGHCVHFTDSSADEMVEQDEDEEESISLSITEKEMNSAEIEKNDSPDGENLDFKDPKSHSDYPEETVKEEEGEEMEEEEGSVTQFSSNDSD